NRYPYRQGTRLAAGYARSIRRRARQARRAAGGRTRGSRGKGSASQRSPGRHLANCLSNGCRRIVPNKTFSRHRASRHQGGPNAPGRSMRTEQPTQHMSRTYKAVQATQPGTLEVVERSIVELACWQVRIRVEAWV